MRPREKTYRDWPHRKHPDHCRTTSLEPTGPQTLPRHTHHFSVSTKPVDTRGKILTWRKVICKVQFYIQTNYQVQQKNKDTFKSPKHLSAMNPFLAIYWRMCSNKTKDIPRKMTGAPGNRGSNRKRRKEDPQNDAEGKLWDVSTTSWGGTSSNQLQVWSRKTNPGRQPTGREQQLRDYDVFITLRRTWGWITQKHPPKYTVITTCSSL